MSITIYPKMFWHIPSWADHVIHVGLRAVFFRAPDFVKNLGKALQKWDRGWNYMMLQGQLTYRGLHPWLVITCIVLWKEVCPSVVVSVIKLMSMLDIGLTIVK